MKTLADEIIKMQNEILNALTPGKYEKIDDVAIDLLTRPSGIVSSKDRKRCELFRKAYEDLIIQGRLELNGNSIRLNQ